MIMKVLIVRLFPDEININNYNVQEIGLAKALVKKGNVCDIVLYTNKEQDYEQKIEVDKNKYITIYWMRGKKFLGNAFFDYKKLKKITLQYDIIQSGGYDQIYNIKLLRKLDKPIIIYHGNYYSKYSKGYKKKCLISDLVYKMFRKYKKAAFISKSNISTDFLKRKGFKNVTTIGVGLDIDRFKVDSEKNQLVERLTEEKEDFKYLLYIGKIEERRNTLFLLQLLNNLLKTNPKIKLILVGKGKQEYKDLCKGYVKENNLEKNVIWIDNISQNQISQLYNIANIFLLPTQHEIFGMVLLEAMYFGLPVLTTMNGGSSVLIENGKDGFIEDLDIDKWTNVINENLENKIIGSNARRKIIENFTWDKLSDKFIEVYQKEIEQFKGGK